MNHIFILYQSYLDIQIKKKVFEFFFRELFREIWVFALQVQPVVPSLSVQLEMEKTHVFLTQFNYF